MSGPERIWMLPESKWRAGDYDRKKAHLFVVLGREGDTLTLAPQSVCERQPGDVEMTTALDDIPFHEKCHYCRCREEGRRRKK
jgi:hypothetical protein